MSALRRAAAGQQYAIVVGLIGVIALLAITSSGQAISGLFGSVSNTIQRVQNGAIGGPAVGPFAFTDQTGVTPGAVIDSNAVVLSGSTFTETATCLDGCTAIARNGVWGGSSVAGFQPGDTIAIRQTAAAQFATATTASVTLGGVTSSSWTIMTRASNPNPPGFSFTNQSGVSPSTLISSDAVTLGIFDGPTTAVCGSGCTAIARNGSWGGTSVSGFMSGDTIAIRLTSSASASGSVSATVSVGTTTSASWTVTTVGGCSTMTLPYASEGVYTLTVPAFCTQVLVKAWGAGGGGTTWGNVGGGGGYASGTFSVTAGTNLTIFVGGPGTTFSPGGFGGGGGCRFSGSASHSSGGGRSGVAIASSPSDPLVIAGGGGGGGSGNGGAGGGTTAENGSGTGPGIGGSGSTGGSGGGGGGVGGSWGGGVAGTGGNGTGYSAVSGERGGYGGTPTATGASANGTGGGNGGGYGGGGGGSYGGSGGAAATAGSGPGGGAAGSTDPNYRGGGGGSAGGGGGGGNNAGGGGGYGGGGGGNGGGGGGSGYVRTTGRIGGATLTTGTGRNPPNTGDVDYAANAGLGGPSSTTGNPGRVTLKFQ